MRDDASLAVDPETHPDLLWWLAGTYPEQTLSNASLLLLHFEDLALARDIKGAAEETIAARNLEQIALGCGHRALVSFALDVARSALPRGRWDRPGKARGHLEMAERFAFSERLPAFRERQRVSRFDLERRAGQLRGEVRGLAPEDAPAAWCLLAAMEAAMACHRGRSVRHHALEAADLAVLAIAGDDALESARERQRQCALLSSLLETSGGL